MLEAVIVSAHDNVATAVADLKSGKAAVTRLEDETIELIPASDIPLGHKFALTDIDAGQPIIKYGYSIGIAREKILKGEHVHVHNVESLRGRGDKN